MYDPSQFGWNLPVVGSAMFSKTLLKTRSPALNTRILHAYYISSSFFVGMMLYIQPKLHGIRMSIKVFRNGFNVSFFRDLSSKCGHPNLCRNYDFHPISKGER